MPARHIGAILVDEGKLTSADAEQVLARQRELGWRFGEAAIELNLITDADLRRRSRSNTSSRTWSPARTASARS
jgi:hypothetical protein